jgi:4-aminobutyrate aminotransferase
MTSFLTSKKDMLSPVWPHFTNIEVDYAKGSYIYSNGKKYLDFTSGIGVTNTGHCHPRVVRAIQDQAEKLLHGQATIVYHKPMLDLIGELETILPSTNLNSFFFTNSGSEAVESAIKLARHATGKPNIIAFQGGYHGRTVGALSLTTAKTVYRSSYEPLMSGVHIAPFPYGYRYKNIIKNPDDLTNWCIDELLQLLKTRSSPEETAALIVEPVLGEGGYVVPPMNFFKKLREICDEYGILLIFDEVQTGFGRTGKFFALEHFGVSPDILIIAKGLASGLPLSGIIANKKIAENWKVGSHGGTYGGNPLACAAAVETIRIIKEEGLLENALCLGDKLISKLKEFSQEFSWFGEVRGLGLMIGCEFDDYKSISKTRIAKTIRERCLEKGLLLLTCGTYDHVIRWIPPLNVTLQEVTWGLNVFYKELKKFNREVSDFD